MPNQAPASEPARRDGLAGDGRPRATGVVTLSITGPLNREAGARYEHRLRSLVGPGTGVLLLDLTRAEYVDSDGVRWLQGLQGDLAARRVELRLLVRPGSPPQRTLRLLQLERVFAIQTT